MPAVSGKSSCRQRQPSRPRPRPRRQLTAAVTVVRASIAFVFEVAFVVSAMVIVDAAGFVTSGFVAVAPTHPHRPVLRRLRSWSSLSTQRAMSFHDDDDNDDDGRSDDASRRGALSRILAGTASVAASTTAAATNSAVASPPLAAVNAASTASILPSSFPLSVPSPPTYDQSKTWPLGKVAFSLLPLAGSYTRRATVDETLIPNRMWTHDQIQGVVNVNVPVRQTTIKLSEASGGGLWVHNPVAPTPEHIRRVRSLEALHGPVRHIVLGTVALEHKATLGPFAQYFPDATVWVQPGQWSFPFKLPLEFLGVVQNARRGKLRQLPSSAFLHGEFNSGGGIRKGRGARSNETEQELQGMERKYRRWAERDPLTLIPEWTVDIDYETLGPFEFKSVGGFSETAFFHKMSKTLVVTDTVCSVTKIPPPIIQEDPRALLYHARNSIDELVIDDEQTRERGWRRMVQFGLVFFPSQIDVVPVFQALRQARNVNPSIRQLGEGGVPLALYPWTWRNGNDGDVANFEAISRNGALFCPPILTKLILDREPRRTLEWVEKVAARFDFSHVVPCHLNNFVEATPNDFRAAFDPLRSNPMKNTKEVYPQRALGEDLALLQEASDILTKYGIVAESAVCDLEPARTAGRFAATASQ